MNAAPIKPNQDFLKLLTEMGIAEQVAEHALICTGNDSVEAAMTFLYDNPEVDYSELSFLTNTNQSDGRSGSDTVKSDKDEATGDVNTKNNYEEYDDQFKMVFVINTSLNMGVGKIAAQVAHACLGLFTKLQLTQEAPLDIWVSEGQKKIVLKATDHNQLRELQKKAEKEHLAFQLVQDAGLTQIPAGSFTVLSLFGEIEAVDRITGHLSLL